MNKAREVLAAAYKADLARQLNATPMHPEGSGNFWADTEGWDVIDLDQIAAAGLRALEEAGLRVVPVEPTPAMLHRYADEIGRAEGAVAWRSMLEAAR